MKSSKTSFLRNCISGWNVRNPETNTESRLYAIVSKKGLARCFPDPSILGTFVVTAEASKNRYALPSAKLLYSLYLST